MGDGHPNSALRSLTDSAIFPVSFPMPMPLLVLGLMLCEVLMNMKCVKMRWAVL